MRPYVLPLWPRPDCSDYFPPPPKSKKNKRGQDTSRAKWRDRQCWPLLDELQKGVVRSVLVAAVPPVVTVGQTTGLGFDARTITLFENGCGRALRSRAGPSARGAAL